MIETATDISDVQMLILFDAQTSGGLLISLPESVAELLVERMHDQGIMDATIIGEVVYKPKGKIVVK